jgi:hypothetical protein
VSDLHQLSAVEALGRLFERFDALIGPTWAVPGIPAGESYLGTLWEGGGPNDRQYAAMMTTPFNVLSPCPVLAVPSGFTSNGGALRRADRRADVRRHRRLPGGRRDRAGPAVADGRHVRVAVHCVRAGSCTVRP